MMLRTILVACLFGLTGLVGPAQAAEKASLKISVIYATKKPGPKDPALKKIQRSLEKAFGGYKNFRQLAKHKLSLSLKKTRQIKLPNKQTAGFTYEGTVKKREKIKVSIPKSRVDVTLRAPKRRMFYQAGLRHKDGILILALYLR